MSDSDSVETDATSSEKQEQEVQKEEEKQAETPAPENGNSNGLSLQLEEKIIRQVEVSWTTWLLASWYLTILRILPLYMCAVLFWGQKSPQGQVSPGGSC